MEPGFFIYPEVPSVRSYAIYQLVMSIFIEDNQQTLKSQGLIGIVELSEHLNIQNYLHTKLKL